jgi:hypothetical protein
MKGFITTVTAALLGECQGRRCCSKTCDCEGIHRIINSSRDLSACYNEVYRFIHDYRTRTAGVVSGQSNLKDPTTMKSRLKMSIIPV